MDELDFTIEFNSNLHQQAEAGLFATADDHLRALAKGHDDLTGAAINIREPAKGEKGYLFEATVVVYARPQHVSATEKNEDVQIALKGALDAVERQIRDRRAKLRRRWERPGNDPVTQEVIATVANEPDVPERDE